ncbi:unnamed protein product [Effrenium voratum]|nr:unnamed protein product [Effrenium voratum]
MQLPELAPPLAVPSPPAEAPVPLGVQIPTAKCEEGSVWEPEGRNEVIVLPAMGSVTGESQAKPKPGQILQAMPWFLANQDDSELPFLLPHDWSQDCLELLSCSCGALLVLAFLGIITSLVMMIFNEVMPFICPSHHVQCRLRELTPNESSRRVNVSIFLLCSITLPIAMAACQSHCMCLRVFLREGGLWPWLKGRRDAVLRRCAAAPSALRRCCWRPSKSRVQPGESRELQRCFGVHQDFDVILPSNNFKGIPGLGKKLSPGFPKHWHHTVPDFHETVELSTIEGQGAEIARLVLDDPTWHQPPRCERVLRIESSGAWVAYCSRKAQLRREALAPVPVGPAPEWADLDASVNEQFLLYGTTLHAARLAEFSGQVPGTPDCQRHVLLRRLGGGSQFCETGFMAHEQATEAGYNKDSLDSPWVVLVCRVLLGRPLCHHGQRVGPRLHRDWESGKYGSILLQLDGRREYLLPPEVAEGAYPEFLLILR